MKKATIQLSLNFLIVTIISIVIFSMGIYLMNKFFGAAEGKVLIWDNRMQEEIAALLDDGSKVAIPFDHKNIGNKKYDSFGIGILNIVDEPNTDFRIYVNFTKAYQGAAELCDSLTQSGCGNPDSWLRSTAQSGGPLFIEKTIKKYEQEKFLVGVDVVYAPKGTYIFDVNVTYYNISPSGNRWLSYDNIHKLVVDVGY